MGRALALGLLAMALAPLHRLLDPAWTGPAGLATRASAEAAWASGLLGTSIVVTVAWLLARTVGDRAPLAATERFMDALCAPSKGAFAAGVGLLTLALAALSAQQLFSALPSSVDEMAQLAHASAVAGGRLTLPVPGDPTAWMLQNGVLTPDGWASIYPPGHTLLLAAGLRLGVAWLVGPLVLAVGSAAFFLGADRMLAEERLARLAALLLAVCPFWLLLGSTHLSHATGAACAALVFWTCAEMRVGGIGWSVPAGLATGAFVVTRPLTGLAIALPLLLLAAPWAELRARAATRTWLLGRGAGVALGGAPFAALLFIWNSRLFGDPLRLGYSAAFGPAHGLGFHTDPWGNRYGVREAVAYSGADITQLGAHLFESPLLLTVVIAGALWVGARPKGLRSAGAWIGAALLANALYWHHGVHMGPRMLFETIPAWVLAIVVSAAALVGAETALPARVRGTLVWSLVLGGVGAALLAPGYALAQRGGEESAALSRPPAPARTPSVVFVHGSWSSRITGRLAAAGMRRDSIETALRRNDVCAVDRLSRVVAGSGGGAARDALDFDARPGTPPHLVERRLSPGNTVRVDPAREPEPACLREARADRLGVVELEPLLWQAPPLSGRDVVVARDLGPVANARVLEALGRTAYVYGDFGGTAQLLDYAEGMELLWGGPVVTEVEGSIGPAREESSSNR